MIKTYNNVTLQELNVIAKEVACKIKKQDVIALYGDLGSGKTTLSRLIIQELTKNHNLDVLSPTYNIVSIYNDYIYHFDLYRIEDKEELEHIGINEALLYGISLIEWPQIAEDLFTKYSIDIKITINNKENRNIIVNYKS